MSVRVYSPPSVDRIWHWVYYIEIPIDPIFYLLQEDYGFEGFGFPYAREAVPWYVLAPNLRSCMFVIIQFNVLRNENIGFRMD